MGFEPTTFGVTSQSNITIIIHLSTLHQHSKYHSNNYLWRHSTIKFSTSVLPVCLIFPRYSIVLCSMAPCLLMRTQQCRINHMAEAAYATGPALLGAPRFSLLFFFLKFCFLFKRGAQTVRQSGAPKSLGPPENSWPQKIDPKRFLFVPCFSVSARDPQNRPPKFKRPQTIFLFPVLARDPNSAGH